jgi:MoaA/NifB/PqqE/SkfB family radical SAM enzyme
LHASNPKLHKVITRSDNFNLIIENLKYLHKTRRNKDNLRINLIFVVTTLNIEDLPNFVRLAKGLNINKVVCYYNYIYIPTQKYLSCFFKQELTNNMLEEAQDLAAKFKLDISIPPRFNQKEYSKPGICREPFTQIMFDSQGHILPCDASEDCHEVLDQEKGFMGVWNSPYYQNLRKSLVERISSCYKHCLRANPACVNDFKSHVIYRGARSDSDINLLWGDNF